MSLFLLPLFGTTIRHAAQLLLAEKTKQAQVKQEWAKEILSRFGYKVDVSGTEPPKETQVLVGNHVSFLDIPVLLSIFPSAVFIAKDDLRWWPILGPCIAAAGTIFVSREKNANRTNSRLRIKNILNQKSGTSVVVFPAGTTTVDESIPWKKGIFEVAQETSTPIQLFKISYEPLRESAYIGDDHFLLKVLRLGKIKNKRVSFTWLDRYTKIQNPTLFAETLRNKVTHNS